jgi:hypothetical protein
MRDKGLGGAEDGLSIDAEAGEVARLAEGETVVEIVETGLIGCGQGDDLDVMGMAKSKPACSALAFWALSWASHQGLESASSFCRSAGRRRHARSDMARAG